MRRRSFFLASLLLPVQAVPAPSGWAVIRSSDIRWSVSAAPGTLPRIWDEADRMSAYWDNASHDMLELLPKQSDQSPVGGIRHSRNPILSTPVGQELHGCIVTDTDHAIENGIDAALWIGGFHESEGEIELAKAFTRDAQTLRNRRRPEIVAAWEALERQWLDEGVDYFGSGAAHRERA